MIDCLNCLKCDFSELSTGKKPEFDAAKRHVGYERSNKTLTTEKMCRNQTL